MEVFTSFFPFLSFQCLLSNFELEKQKVLFENVENIHCHLKEVYKNILKLIVSWEMFFFFYFEEKEPSKNNPWPTQPDVFISSKCQGFSLGLDFLQLSMAFGTIFHRVCVHIAAYTLVLSFEFQHWNTLDIYVQIQFFYNEDFTVSNNLDEDVIQCSVICPSFSFYVQSVRNQ